MGAWKSEQDAVKVVSLQPNDLISYISNIRLLVFFVVRQRLDEEKLKTALTRLIRDHLPVLGGRIKINKQTKRSECHVPVHFEDDYQMFEWSATTIDKAIDNVLGELGPKRSAETITLGPDVRDVERQWAPKSWPVERKFEKRDAPILFVHLTHHTDGSVLALNIPHLISDMHGIGCLVRAWMQVSAGEQPEPFLNLQPGRLDGVRDLPKAELYRLGKYRLASRRDTLKLYAGILPDHVLRSTETRHIMYMPVSLVDSLRLRYNQELKEKYGSEATQLTNGSIMGALCAKLSLIARGRDIKTSLNETVTARGRVSALPKNAPYLHNVFHFVPTRVSIPQTPLMEMAHTHRRNVLAALEPQNVERDLAVIRASVETGRPFNICEAYEWPYYVSNWTGAWRDVDFSSAVQGRGQNDQSQHLPAVVLGHGVERGMPSRNNLPIMSKAEGGYWIDFACPKRNMVAVRELLEKDPQLRSL